MNQPAKDEAQVPPEVRDALKALSPDNKATCLALRELAFEAADEHAEIGPLTETLKWGVPSYLTAATKAGTTLRIWQTKDGQRPALFVNCQSRLVDRFRELYPDRFEYQGNRALVLKSGVAEAADALKHCMALTLTYHLWK